MRGLVGFAFNAAIYQVDEYMQPDVMNKCLSRRPLFVIQRCFQALPPNTSHILECTNLQELQKHQEMRTKICTLVPLTAMLEAILKGDQIKYIGGKDFCSETPSTR